MNNLQQTILECLNPQIEVSQLQEEGCPSLFSISGQTSAVTSVLGLIEQNIIEHHPEQAKDFHSTKVSYLGNVTKVAWKRVPMKDFSLPVEFVSRMLRDKLSRNANYSENCYVAYTLNQEFCLIGSSEEIRNVVMKTITSLECTKSYLKDYAYLLLTWIYEDGCYIFPHLNGETDER